MKFDLTNDELIADMPQNRAVNHPYDDEIVPPPEVLCYSVNEVLAEKSRALYERQGRARDVYDLVHVSAAFRDHVDRDKARTTQKAKFDFKGLPAPSVELILGHIDSDVVRVNWSSQLAHQLPVLPDFELFMDALSDALTWWMDPETPVKEFVAIPGNPGETTATRVAFPQRTDASRLGIGSQALWRITYAARNRLCLRVQYKGVQRMVEPYSFRYPRTGNTLLYVWERFRDTASTQQIKAFKLSEIEDVVVTAEPYDPRYTVEL